MESESTPTKAEQIKALKLEQIKLEKQKLELYMLQASPYKCQAKLLYFVKCVWHIIEPGREFLSNWHIEAICVHLEMVTRGKIRKLLINVPPGTCKSTIVSVVWPVWVWLQKPNRRFLTGSHNERLAVRDARKSRQIMESSWFQEMFPGKIRFSKDQNQKTKYENQNTGYRQVFSMGGGVTGEKGDIVIIDDPHDAKKAMYSATLRETAINAFDQAISTRLINRASALVIIMQRLHQGDLSGHVLKEGGWEHLMFPMEFEPSRRCKTSLGIQDKRTKEGELLWPEYYDQEQIEEKKQRLRPLGVAGQFQQRPSPDEGGIIDVKKFKRYLTPPPREHCIEIVQIWDTAQKSNELQNDPSVCGTWARRHDGFYLLDVFRGWLTYPKLVKKAIDLYNEHKPSRVIIEDKSSGQSLIQSLQEGSTIPVMPFMPINDKVTRMATEAGAIDAGNVWIPQASEWVDVALGEWACFPMAEHDDQTDMLSMALNYFRTHSFFDEQSLGSFGERDSAKQDW